MPVSPTYPGVYVQEVPSGVRTVTGVSTSVALFIGYTRSGPLNAPTQIFSYTDYVRAFSDDTSASDMARQVKMFFLNGGTQAVVLRIADGAVAAAIDLQNEAGTGVLTLTARNPGTQGDNIRAAVTYDGNQPEDTFNLYLFRWEAQSNGTVVRRDEETHTGLSMNPNSPAYAVEYLNSNSRLVEAEAATALTADAGYSRSGRYLSETDFADATASAWNATVTSASNKIQISVDDSRYVTVTLPRIGENAPISGTPIATQAELEAAIAEAITSAYTALTLSDPAPIVAFDEPTGYKVLRVTSSNDGAVWIRPATAGDVAVALRLGAAQGGLEVGPYAKYRPAPTGITLAPTDGTALDALVDDVTDTTAGPDGAFTIRGYDSSGTASDVRIDVDFGALATGDVVARLEAIRDAFNDYAPAGGSVFPWRATLWGNRLAIVPTTSTVPDGSDDNRASGFAVEADLPSLATSDFTDSLRSYSLGTSGAGTYQANGVPGNNGSATTSASDYDAAYEIVRQEVDLFNLLLLPGLPSNSAFLEDLWPNASVFCEERRALLLMEAPADWTGTTTPTNEISSLRTGLSKQYAALYHPRLTIKESGIKVNISPVGAVAGLMARTDAARGVWKAPAGTEGDIRGVVGVAEMLSDRQNGVLNPQGINVIRAFPEGVVCWGARTMDGADSFASEYKYVPIRRLANYIEESLFRGLKWVVFEPNDEPLWAQIRLNVGAFMHNLFRQGAFQGKTPAEAYFVKCDAETTTQNDRNLGIVNIWVGFAPLKPAEFVILSLQQMAGQVAV